MLRAHKIELRLTLAQAVCLDKACGLKRHCYNQLVHFAIRSHCASLNIRQLIIHKK
nr:helix-turn-helix domain-containing protein [Chromatium okenii]